MARALADVECTTLCARTEPAHGRALVGVCLGDDQGARVQTEVVLSVGSCGCNNLRDVLGGATPDKSPETTTTIPTAPATSKDQATAESVESKGKILTVCGNGLGTSLFLKNTLDQVLDTWGWGGLVSTEATDTISAKGRAKEVDFLLTSAEIARTLGDVGVPVYVIDNFTSTAEVDRALRELYDI